VTKDEENQAIALKIMLWQGENARVFIAEQLGAVAFADDEPGIARWRAIAAVYDELDREIRQ
jgi:hypothetical protein